jgi:hypothetical protein
MTAPLTVFDTGEVLEPHIYPDQSGWVDFDNDESASILKIQVVPSRTDDETTVIKFESHADFGRVALERDGEQVWAGGAVQGPEAQTSRTIADLDGTVDAADWIRSGHVLDDNEVAYLRSLVLPPPSAV